MLGGKPALFGATGNADHFGAERLAPLPRDQADATGGGEE